MKRKPKPPCPLDALRPRKEPPNLTRADYEDNEEAYRRGAKEAEDRLQNKDWNSVEWLAFQKMIADNLERASFPATKGSDVNDLISRLASIDRASWTNAQLLERIAAILERAFPAPRFSTKMAVEMRKVLDDYQKPKPKKPTRRGR